MPNERINLKCVCCLNLHDRITELEQQLAEQREELDIERRKNAWLVHDAGILKMAFDNWQNELHSPLPDAMPPACNDSEGTSFVAVNSPEEVVALVKALTPSAETKAAYWGSDEHDIASWTDIKTIMRLIREQTLQGGEKDE